MSTDKDRPLDIVLWGAPQVGKSTLLATYLCRHPPSWLDKSAPETQETIDELTAIWNTLLMNRLPVASLEAKYYPLRRRDGRLIRFRDMKGGNVIDMARNREDAAAMRQADGVLMMVEWPGQRSVQNQIAADGARRYADSKSVLVVTKVECFLTQEYTAKFSLAPMNVAQELGLADEFLELLQAMSPSNIVPVSVYGYNDGSPAHYRDEFGRLVPQNIKPYNVALPFERLLVSLL